MFLQLTHLIANKWKWQCDNIMQMTILKDSWEEAISILKLTMNKTICCNFAMLCHQQCAFFLLFHNYCAIWWICSTPLSNVFFCACKVLLFTSHECIKFNLLNNIYFLLPFSPFRISFVSFPLHFFSPPFSFFPFPILKSPMDNSLFS
jgi:hypothetical protein